MYNNWLVKLIAMTKTTKPAAHTENHTEAISKDIEVHINHRQMATERETETATQRQTATQTDSHTDRQRDTETDTQRDRQRHTDR